MERTEVGHVETIGNEVWCARLHHTRRDFSDTPWYDAGDGGTCFTVTRWRGMDPEYTTSEVPALLREKLQAEGRWPQYVQTP
jgi:hypothetical protein